jgi:hypothetical protein
MLMELFDSLRNESVEGDEALAHAPRPPAANRPYRRRESVLVSALSLVGRTSRRRWILWLVTLPILVVLAACNTTESALPAAGDKLVLPPDDRVGPSLRGIPSFDESTLSGETASWYAQVLDSIDNPGTHFDPLEVAGWDDIYEYGRTLHTYVQSVLVAFRLTGDLRLLDHVDAIAERMRAELRDGWRDTLDGTDGTRDGYLNWVDRKESGSYRGKDTMRANEMKTHALVAMVAYALDVNRDLPSPSGRDYAAHADFWRDYLVNHFEAKWRERRDVPSGFPFMGHQGMHPYYSWVKWHYYMGLLTGDEGYTAEAERMADIVWSELRLLDTPAGKAYVWAGSIAAVGGSGDVLQATTYARYVYGDVVEFHLEGFHQWASSTEMQRFARTFTEFIIDREDPLQNGGFAADIGGGVPRADLDRNSEATPMTVDRYRISSFALIGAWDATGQIRDITAEVYATRGDRGATWLTAAGVLEAHMSTAQETMASRSDR